MSCVSAPMKAAKKQKPVEPVLFLLNADANDEHFDGMNCALVEIGQEHAAQLLQLRIVFQRAKGAASASSLYEMYYWDHSARWFDSCRTTGIEAPDDWRRLEPAELTPPAISPPFADENVERSECDQLVVDVDGVKWTAIAKHADVYVVTRTIPWAEIEKIAGGAR